VNQSWYALKYQRLQMFYLLSIKTRVQTLSKNILNVHCIHVHDERC